VTAQEIDMLADLMVSTVKAAVTPLLDRIAVLEQKGIQPEPVVEPSEDDLAAAFASRLRKELPNVEVA
jgi:hypothetical protein